MRCDRCKAPIEEGEERELHGQMLCEDCHIDALSPARACDPWAVYSAKSFLRKSETDHQITETQARILEILEETGGIELSLLSERLRMKPPDVERDIAALRHMEKVRGEPRRGKRIIRLW